MRRRRKIFVVAIALTSLATMAGVAIFLWPPHARPEVTLTTLTRPKPGMSEADVEAIFGPPTGDLTGNPPATVPRPVAGGRLLLYSGRRATVTVEFDAGGQLVRSFPEIHEVSGLERIRLRLNWW
jgi:hypothetical protein